VLDAVYFDTDDLRLARAGHALRHRSRDGDVGTWTLKTTRAQHGSQAERDEYDLAGPLRRMPPEIASALAAVLGASPLGRTARITTERTTTLVHRGDTTVEVARDQVRSRVRRKVGPTFHEAELELVRGDVAALDELERALRSVGAHPSHWTSKLHHVLGEVAPPSTAPPNTLADLVTRAFATALDRLLRHDPLLRLDADVEAVHQARVATRRLRSDLRSLRPFLDASTADALHDDLTWIAALMGAVRDLDVMVELLTAMRDRVSADDAAWDALLAHLHDARGPALLTLREALDSDRFLGLVELIRVGTVAPHLGDDVDATMPATEAAEVVAERAWKRLTRAVEGLSDDPDDEALHDIRKRSKQARYAHELVAPVASKRVVRRTAAIEALQDLLGTFQDTVVLRTWLDDTAPTLSGAPAYLAGRLRATAEAQGDALRARFPRQWKRTHRA
jgi:CHAD domain-containing protein